MANLQIQVEGSTATTAPVSATVPYPSEYDSLLPHPDSLAAVT